MNQKLSGRDRTNHPELARANGYTDRIEDLNWSDLNINRIVKQLLNWIYS